MSRINKNLSPYTSFLQLKTIFLAFSIFALFSIRDLISPILLFILLDLAFCVYIISLFYTRYKYLLLIHPIFLFISSYGFLIPISEIGVGFTYISTFNILIDPDSLLINNEALINAYGDTRKIFGIGALYFAILPIIWLPSFLYSDPPEILLYYSMGLFNVIYVAIVVYISRLFGVLDNKKLLMISLYAIVSPTFLEINSNLHRYGLLFCGLFLFLVSYIGLINLKQSIIHKLGLILSLIISIVFIGLSKPQLIFVLLLFIFMDLFISNRLRLPIISNIYKKLDKKIFLLISILVIDLAAIILIPESYISEAVDMGGQFSSLANIPIFGFILRVIYAALSPFPWIGFSQFILYGFNYSFLILHIFSAFLAVWMILSAIIKSGQIFKSKEYDRTIVVFGICIIFSLMFSSIGFHVYIAPALPFLAVVLLNKKTRVNLMYPVAFCFTMEIFAQIARLF